MIQNDYNRTFESYRRDRRRRRAQTAGPQRDLGRNAEVLEQLERAEQSEVRDEQLTKDVNDFFAGATRQAAQIVGKLSDAQEQETAEILGDEIREFLTDVIRRAEVFMTELPPGPAMQELEAKMRNLIGKPLDAFRIAGTSNADKHLGLDPFTVGEAEEEAGSSDGPAAQAPLPSGPSADGGEGQAGVDDWKPIPILGDAVTQGPADVDLEPLGEPMVEATEEQSTTLEPTPERELVPERQLVPEPEPLPEPEEPKAAVVEPDPAARIDLESAASGVAGGSSAMAMVERFAEDPERLRKALQAMINSGLLSKNQAVDLFRAVYRGP